MPYREGMSIPPGFEETIYGEVGAADYYKEELAEGDENGLDPTAPVNEKAAYFRDLQNEMLANNTNISQ